MQSLIEFRNITKKMGQNIACNDISFTIQKGQIHAIIGENGAGKSTMVKMLAGVTDITSGEIFLNQKNYAPKSAQDAFKNKIALVHQHFVLADELTGLDNLILSANSGQNSLASKNPQAVLKQAECILHKFNWKLNLNKKVINTSVGEQQRLEILKALMPDPDIIIFDEPTAVLTPQESEEFLNFLLLLKTQGKTIILITHKLTEIKRVADQLSILRLGRHIGTYTNEILSIETMAELMIGRHIQRPPSLKNKDLQKNIFTLAHVNLQIRPGEILGVAGIEGNGQSDLIQLLRAEFTKVNLHFGDVTEDRLRLSVFPEFNLTEHMLLKYGNIFVKNGFIQKNNLNTETQSLLHKWDVRPAEINKPLVEFSGGNQQKFMVGRELYSQPQILLAAHPTRGVDIGAQESIHQALIEHSRKGHSVILISSDLDEVLYLSDRYIVLNNKKVYGTFERQQMSEQQIGLLMASDQQQDFRAFDQGYL